jgi:hypothetical protein
MRFITIDNQIKGAIEEAGESLKKDADRTGVTVNIARILNCLIRVSERGRKLSSVAWVLK